MRSQRKILLYDLAVGIVPVRDEPSSTIIRIVTQVEFGVGDPLMRLTESVRDTAREVLRYAL